MKLTCNRTTLLAAFERVAPAAAGRTTKPVLECAKIIAGESVVVMATNLEIGVRAEVRGVDVDRAGECFVPAGKFLALLKEAKGENVTLAADDKGVTLSTESGKFKLGGWDAGDFPDVGVVEGESHELPAESVKELIRSVAFAADRKDTGARWAVTGILWEIEENLVRCVATDTKRLAILAKPSTGPAVKGNFLLPAKAMSLVERTAEGPVRVTFGKTEVSFAFEGFSLTTKLVEGRFPPHKEVTPRTFAHDVKVCGGDLASALRQARVFADQDGKRVDLEFAGDSLTVTSAGEGAESSVRLSVRDGCEMTIAFDPSYVLDVLKLAAGDVTLRLNSSEKPAVFVVGELTYLLMPLAG